MNSIFMGLLLNVFLSQNLKIAVKITFDGRPCIGQ